MSTTHPSTFSAAAVSARAKFVGEEPSFGIVSDDSDLSRFPDVWRPLASAVLHSLRSSGKWERWAAPGSALSHFESLEDACAAHERDDKRCYQVVTELAWWGARRGGDDDDAALAVTLMLARGIQNMAEEMLSDVCELDHLFTAVWEEVKRAEPYLGRRAADFLLRRAHQRLCRPAAGMVSRVKRVSLDHLAAAESSGASDWLLDMAQAQVQDDVQVEDPLTDLVDLLVWARGVGVIDHAEVGLLVELLAEERSGLPREEAQRVVGQRHGMGMRTVRRRRDATTARLREAAPAYLSAIA